MAFLRLCFRSCVVGVCAVLLAGCGAAAPEPTPTPTGSLEPAPGVISLAEKGYEQGPATLIPVPDDVAITQYVDQPNVITASFSQPEGAVIAEVLRAELPGAGWEITADTPEAILFTRPGWDGAFTISQGSDSQGPGSGGAASKTVSALTVRAAPQ